MKISIIIPVWNEEKNIVNTLKYLLENSKESEIMVVDGQSTDATRDLVRGFEQVRLLESPKKGRAAQMNFGATYASNSILYFLHADARPPVNFESQIAEAVEAGQELGCYRFRFDDNRLMLRINSFFTRFPYLWCRGGDQSLFVTQNAWKQLGGFDEKFEIMEEYDFIRRAQAINKFYIIPDNVLVSARKYSTNSWLKVMWANFLAFRQFKKGIPTAEIKKNYQRNLNPYL